MASLLGFKVFRGKFFQILWEGMPNSTAYGF